jgi:ABC-2 type transport system ATP-binding protein
LTAPTPLHTLARHGGLGDDRVSDILVVRELSKTYRSRTQGEVRALSDVSLRVGPGEIVGLLGANGAGKTTTIKAVCGLVRPTSGSIEIDGIDVVHRRRAAARKLAAVLEGNRTIYWRLTVRENLEYFAALRGLRAKAVRAQIDELITRFRLDDKTDVPAMKLSRGMQQKLALACTVLPGTPLLLLDEPTLGLDLEISYELRGYLRGLAHEGRGILLSSHDMQVVRDVCDRVVIIHSGRVVADDAIPNLVALFKARAVRVCLEAPLTDEAVAELSSSFAAVRVIEGDEPCLEVSLRDSAEFYRLIDELRAAGAAVATCESVQPDLEEVFLSFVSRGAS